MPASQAIPERAVFAVHELISTLKHGLEMNFPSLWVEGEVSNFIAARSGHWYFTLKDAQAQIRCAFFRYQRGRTPPLQNGQQVVIQGQATLFAARGELQLVVKQVQDSGAGALHQAFIRCKEKLQAEGLFDAALKRPLPAKPYCIGVISSPSGAAIHDVISTLARRNPFSRVILYPSLVQGEQAAEQLRLALATAIRRQECDTLLITRGGGSLEDLQAFNDEQLARELAASPIPTVSAIGHEVDFSICDFVADARAATPTAAAELLSPNQQEKLRELLAIKRQLMLLSSQQLSHQRHHWQQLEQRLHRQAPHRQLAERLQQLDALEQRLSFVQKSHLRQARSKVDQIKLSLHSPQTRIDHAKTKLAQLKQRLASARKQHAKQDQQRLGALSQRLKNAAPQATLARGYAIAWNGETALRSIHLADAKNLRLQLADGELAVTINKRD